MTDTEVYYPSLAALQAAHKKVMQAYRQQESKAEPIADLIEELIRKGRETGVVLADPEDRMYAQSLIDYWATILYRRARERPDVSLTDYDPNQLPKLPDEPCPYVGLNAFLEERAGDFFGRDGLLAVAINKVTQGRLLIVFGASGSGKSSLVLAGLIPRLKQGAVPGSEKWNYRLGCMVPGSDPFANLAKKLAECSSKVGEEAEPTRRAAPQAEALLEDPACLVQWLNARSDVPVVLVVDQFEEVFTLCRHDASRDAFAATLVNVVQAPGPRHTVILTMREDFIRKAGGLPIPPDLFQGALLAMTAMNEAELREAIEKPAKKVGLTFEKDLVDRLVLEVRLEQLVLTDELEQKLKDVMPDRSPSDAKVAELLSDLKMKQLPRDVGHEEAALPLLQFTLLELWKRRDCNQGTWEAYRELGGCRNALAHVADELYAKLAPEERVTFEHIFIRCLTRLSDDRTTFVRQRVRLDDPCDIGRPRDQVDSVLKRLAEAQLVRVTGDPNVPGDQQVEVAHETLLRSWTRLRQWLAHERDRIGRRQRLTDLAREWAERNWDEGALLRGSFLEEVLPGGKQPEELEKELDLDQRTVEFLHASLKMREREAAAAARLRRTNTWLIASVIIVAVLFLVAAAFGVLAMRYADQQTAESRARKRAWDATSMLDVDPELSTHLALYAVQATLPAQPLLEAEAALHRAVQSPLRRTFTGHTLAVVDVAYSPDGKLLATASADKTVKLWDPDSATELRTLTHKAEVNGIAFSPDGKLLAAACVDRTARVWDAASGKEQSVLGGHSGAVNDVAFSPDGQYLATAGADMTVRVWNVISATEVLSLIGHTAPVLSVAFSPDGRLLATGSADQTAKVWIIASGQVSVTLSGHADWVIGVAFSPDGKRLATASADRTARIWDTSSGGESRSLSGHTDWVRGVAFSPDGTRLTTVSADKTAKVWSVASGKEMLTLSGHTAAIWGVAYSPDGERLATASADRTAKTWSIAPGQSLRTLLGHTGWVHGVAYSPRGDYMATAGEDKTAKIWNVGSGKVLTLTGHTDVINGIAFSPEDGQRVATASADKTVRIWNVVSATEVLSLTGHTDSLFGVAFSPDGNLLATGSADMTVRVWKVISATQVLSATEVLSLTGHTATVWDVAYDPGGKRLATASADGTARLWDAATGKKQICVLGNRTEATSQSGPARASHDDQVYAVVFSPDGKRLATASKDKTAKVWDAGSCRELFTLIGHTDEVRSVAFNPDGTRLATAGLDGTVKVWNAQSGEPLFTLLGPVAAVRDIAYSPDGKRLVSVGEDGSVRMYTLDITELVEAAKGRLTHDMTPEQCLNFLGQETCPPLRSSGTRREADTWKANYGLRFSAG